jgi:hypothetical protein
VCNILTRQTQFFPPTVVIDEISLEITASDMAFQKVGTARFFKGLKKPAAQGFSPKRFI